MTRIVAFTGKRFHGKDSAAKALYPLEFKHISFADPLREIVSIVYGISMEEMTDPVLKEQVLERYPFRSPREILTKIGTEGFRNLIADDTWVQAFLRRASEHKAVVISDLRFLNEEKALRSANALIIRIVNPRVNNQDAVAQHRSETEMDSIVPDYTILNDDTMEVLHERVMEIVGGEYGEYYADY